MFNLRVYIKELSIPPQLPQRNKRHINPDAKNDLLSIAVPGPSTRALF